MARNVPVVEGSGSLTVTEAPALGAVTIAANDGVGTRTVTVKVADLAGPRGLIAQLENALSSIPK